MLRGPVEASNNSAWAAMYFFRFQTTGARLASTSPSPRLRAEGWGEGDHPRVLFCRESPSPGSLRDPTSPRKRGEVNQTCGNRHHRNKLNSTNLVLPSLRLR